MSFKRLIEGKKRIIEKKRVKIKEKMDLKDFQTVTNKQGVEFKTGQPVEFNYIRNPESLKRHIKDNKFQQDIEPSGKYMIMSSGFTPPGWESGKIKFNFPLVIYFNLSGKFIYDENSWKNFLKNKFNATGKKLTQKLIYQGFDGIVTVDNKGYTSEIVSLKK